MADIFDNRLPAGHWKLSDPRACTPAVILSRQELALNSCAVPDVWQGSKDPAVEKRHQEAAQILKARYLRF